LSNINDTEAIENRPAGDAADYVLGAILEECDGQVRVVVPLKDHFLRAAKRGTGLREGPCNLAKAIVASSQAMDSFVIAATNEGPIVFDYAKRN
jgi:hypothetical protein